MGSLQREAPGHGEILYVGEILADAPAASRPVRSVRTFGSLQMDAGAQNPAERFALEHGGARLQLDATLLGETQQLKEGSLYMVIGEVKSGQRGPFLEARQARNVDGMDIELFDSALRLFRDWHG